VDWGVAFIGGSPICLKLTLQGNTLMASRAELELRAASANVVSANYPNDSKFEQAIIFAEKARTSTSTATTIVAPASKDFVSGGANV
jgi:hypothetical protein